MESKTLNSGYKLNDQGQAILDGVEIVEFIGFSPVEWEERHVPKEGPYKGVICFGIADEGDRLYILERVDECWDQDYKTGRINTWLVTSVGTRDKMTTLKPIYVQYSYLAAVAYCEGWESAMQYHGLGGS